MLFADIPGLQRVKEQLLTSARSGKIAHAQLFQGSEGALNLPLALAYATYLHCLNKGDKDACGSCAACSKSLKYIHPDTNFVFPSGTLKGEKDEERLKAERLKTWRAFLLEQPFGNLNDWVNYYGGEDKQVNISKDESREIIRSLSLKAFESRYKIMIIWQPEFMHPSAANGILKILEEPPPDTVFLLVTNNAEQLLSTIVSRTQNVQVPMLTDEELGKYLAHTQTLETGPRTRIVRHAEGNLMLALALMDTAVDDNQEIFSEWMLACLKKDYVKMVGLSEVFHELDKLSQKNLLQYGLTMLREMVLQLAGATQMSRVQEGELKFVKDFSLVMTTAKIEKASQWINDAEYYLERNGSAKMIFLDLSLKISKIINPDL
jgi:DNA polymerase-3 subunit delta'